MLSICWLDARTVVINSWELIPHKNFHKYHLIFPHNSKFLLWPIYHPHLRDGGKGKKKDRVNWLLKFAQLVNDKFRSQTGLLSSDPYLPHVYIYIETRLLSRIQSREKAL